MKFGDEELTGKELGPVRFSFNNDAAKQHIGLARRYLGDMKQRMQLGNLGQLYDEKTLKDGSIIKMWSNKNGLADVDLIDIVSPEGNPLNNIDKEIVLGYIIRCISNDESLFTIKVDLPNGDIFDLTSIAENGVFPTTNDVDSGIIKLTDDTGFSDNGCKLVDAREYIDFVETYTNKYQAVCPTFINNISSNENQGTITVTADPASNPYEFPPPYIDACTFTYYLTYDMVPTDETSPPDIELGVVQGKYTPSLDYVETWDDYKDDIVAAANSAIASTVYPYWTAYYDAAFNFDHSFYINYPGPYDIVNSSLRAGDMWRRKDGAGFLINAGVFFDGPIFIIGDKGSSNGNMSFFMLPFGDTRKFSINPVAAASVDSLDDTVVTDITWTDPNLGPEVAGPITNFTDATAECRDHSGVKGLLYNHDQVITTVTNDTDWIITGGFGVPIKVPYGQHKCHVTSSSLNESEAEIYIYTDKKIIIHKIKIPAFDTKHFIINVSEIIVEGSEFSIINN